MTTRLAEAAAIAACDAVVDRLDLGSGPGLLRIYSAGSGVPATANTALTDQVLLAELTLSDPAFGAAAIVGSNAEADANAITGDNAANATGTAAFFRAVDSTGAVVMQGNIGTSGAELILNSTSINVGVQVNVASWEHRQPLAN